MCDEIAARERGWGLGTLLAPIVVLMQLLRSCSSFRRINLKILLLVRLSNLLFFEDYKQKDSFFCES